MRKVYERRTAHYDGRNVMTIGQLDPLGQMT